jgi:Ca-activated chloride channel family protein
MAELLAGEIASEDRTALEKHLLDCASCRGDFEVARAGARIEWADVAVPKEVIEATLASFREPAPVVRLLRWATAAAAVFGLAALLIASSRTTKAQPPAEPVAVVRPPMLATMQDAAVGAMVCKDEDGRPVGELGLKSHEVTVEILDGVAKTTVEENFENHTVRRLEGTFNFPLPSDASISRLALEVNGKIEEGTCLERERAREVFEGIVRRMQDPALLEWQPGGFFKCRVFPIEPRSTKRVIVAYTQALPCFRGKMSYVYPLASEKTRTHAPEEVRISVQARFSGALAKIESPSHHLEVQRKNANEAAMSFHAAHYRPNNDFVVTMEPGPEEVRVVSHKTDGEDGYFACFATPQGGGERTPSRYAFVLDVSASTSAPRLDVAKRLVRAMMERRIDGDRFEVLAHNIDVECSGEVDLRSANTFMDRLQPIGGSDVLQALQAAGDAEVIYIGKGAPSFGELDTSKILEAMKGRRVRTIAVGSDANVALLERLGGMMRVSPNDDVAKRVGEIAATIGAPVLSDVKVDGGDAVYDVVGVRDLFYGERLIVSGRYRGPTTKLTISGRGYRREVDVAFPPKEEGNNYVRRLWAQRRVADLLAKGPATKAGVTDLGVKYQIMTPYTSFLVLETEQMWKDHQLKREVQKQDEVLGKKGEDHRVQIDQAQIEITKNLRDAQRYLNARMFEQARKEFEIAESRIQKLPAEQKPLKDLLPWVTESITKSRTAQALDERRTEQEKRRIAEAEAAAHDLPLKREITRKVAHLLELSYMAVDQKKYDRCINLCDEILQIDPNYPVAKELKEDAEKSRHKEEYWSVLAQKVDILKRLTDDDEQPMLPKSTSMRYPSREEWAEVSKRLTEPVIKTEGGPAEWEGPVGKLLPERKAVREPKPVVPVTPMSPTVVAKSEPAKPEEPRPVERPEPLPAPTEAERPREIPKPRDPVAQGLEGQKGLAPDTSTTTLVIRTLPEEARTRAIRETNEEQLRRERQLTTMQGWRNEATGTYDTFGKVGELELSRWAQLDWDGYLALPSQGGVRSDFPGIFTSSTNLAAPGAPTTDALPINGEGLDFFAPQLKLRQHLSQPFFMENGEFARINEPQRHLDAPENMQVFVRQLEVQLAQIQELTTKVDEHRAKLSKSLNEKSLAVTDLQYARQMAERLEADLAELEAKKIELSISSQDELKGITLAGGNVNVAPRKTLEAKVTAVESQIGRVVISIGKEDGVLEGDVFTVNRGGDFLAKIVVNLADRKWSSAKVVFHRSDPRVGDDVTNLVYVAPARSGVGLIACTVPPLAMEVVTASEDGSSVILSSKTVDAAPEMILAVIRTGKFVALIRAERIAIGQVEAKVLQGLAVGRILPGDRAVFIADPKTYLALLPLEVRMDLSSRASQQAIRAKMRLKE